MDFVCEECGSSEFNEGYCRKCGLFYPKTAPELAYFLWETEEVRTKRSYTDFAKGRPWVDCQNDIVAKMLTYPKAVEFVESKMRTSWQPVDLGTIVVAPAKVWRVDTWKRTMKELAARKCKIPDCYRMVHTSSESGRRTRRRMCGKHYLEFQWVSYYEYRFKKHRRSK